MIQKGNYELRFLFESDLYSGSKEHVYRVGFYTIPYIQACIWRWYMSNARKKPYHVLDSMYRIGNGLGMSLLLIRMI
jgi:hypothetical protein